MTVPHFLGSSEKACRPNLADASDPSKGPHHVAERSDQQGQRPGDNDSHTQRGRQYGAAELPGRRVLSKQHAESVEDGPVADVDYRRQRNHQQPPVPGSSLYYWIPFEKRGRRPAPQPQLGTRDDVSGRASRASRGSGGAPSRTPCPPQAAASPPARGRSSRRGPWRRKGRQASSWCWASSKHA
jgi:hypothetical protein